MRWCYKTVHYSLKKEGFLGSVFLDEAEVEQSLNEYGQAGWELISITETQDGLIAIFKQPLDYVDDPISPEKMEKSTMVLEEKESALITEDDIIEEESKDDAHPDDDLQSIRIE